MHTIDLQIQSTGSDGKHPPREIVAMARERGVTIIAVTDHDTVAGIDEALRAGQEFGVRVIAGIEISVEEHGAHILGYGIEHKNLALLGELEKAQASRIEGAKKMVENFCRAGFVVEWEDVVCEAKGPTIARPHIARAVLGRQENKEKLGDVISTHDFIEKFLSDESPYYVHRAHMLAQQAIALIHDAGGVAVWSHPAVHFRKPQTPLAEAVSSEVDYEALEKFLMELIGWGIDGIEVFNPSHTEDDIEFLIGLVAQHHLIMTAGSDFHELGGDTGRSTGELHAATAVGDYETHGYATDIIITRLDEAVKKRRA